MIHKLIDWYLAYAERRARKRMGGVPIMWMLYSPDKEPPNVFTHLHPDIEQDEELHEAFRAAAKLVRERWQA